MSTVTQGLYITVIGMGLVFITLSFILLLMTLLTKLFPVKIPIPKKFQPEPTTDESPEIEIEKVAAISIALVKAMTEERRMSPLPETIIPEIRLSAWVTYGRARQLNHPKSRNKSL